MLPHATFSGAVMEELAGRLLDVRKCKFEPKHKNNLANEFCCFANYDLDENINGTSKAR